MPVWSLAKSPVEKTRAACTFCTPLSQPDVQVNERKAGRLGPSAVKEKTALGSEQLSLGTDGMVVAAWVVAVQTRGGEEALERTSKVRLFDSSG